MPRCKICKEFKFSDTHKCPPLWKTLIPDYDDDWQDTYAFSSEFAATKRAEEYDSDSGDHDLLDNAEVEIHVKDADGNILRYICTGEAVPEYRATKI